ncbi:unnamed protein product [Albugo candida]|uniref:Uncharacterized protein n=1 Tax=Albugo candida TaxID=65357 RepID=A0A024GSG3_9STRA|nr:unnamed protein product [Albugo candida]|eukprot:CCI49477.1 unnamed protein product [Albugo candida]
MPTFEKSIILLVICCVLSRRLCHTVSRTFGISFPCLDLNFQHDISALMKTLCIFR